MSAGPVPDGELALDRVEKRFGGVRAVASVTFRVPPRSIVGLIGPNGAGKTTVFNLITGVARPDAGTLRFGDHDLAKMAPARIAATGIARTFQNVRLFGGLTALENLLVACETQKRAHLASAIFRTARHFDDEASMTTRAHDLLRVFELDRFTSASATTLAYGHQRRLEIARAMMLAPKLLLLDEPAAGMNHAEAEALAAQIRALRDDHALSVLIVEHNMALVMGLCDAIHVLDHGESIAHGSPAEVRASPAVIAAYLGEEPCDERAGPRP